MKISLIAAIGRNNEIGKENKLLWNMPADMKHFKETTSGHVVIMGRKTYESIGKPLPNRRNILITRSSDYTAEGMEIAHSLDEALTLVENGGGGWDGEVFIIGGAQLYAEAIDIADKLYITRIDNEVLDADAFFPEFGPEWTETSKRENSADESNPHAFAFITYEKQS
jgi:dihydrofolate reductase